MPTIFAIRAPFRALTVALSLLLLAVTAARASGAEPIVIQDYGIYEHRVDRFEPDPQQVSRERVIVSAVTLLRTADEVDAQLGRMFGLQFRIADMYSLLLFIFILAALINWGMKALFAKLLPLPRNAQDPGLMF